MRSNLKLSAFISVQLYIHVSIYIYLLTCMYIYNLLSNHIRNFKSRSIPCTSMSMQFTRDLTITTDRARPQNQSIFCHVRVNSSHMRFRSKQSPKTSHITGDSTINHVRLVANACHHDRFQSPSFRVKLQLVSHLSETHAVSRRSQTSRKVPIQSNAV